MNYKELEKWTATIGTGYLKAEIRVCIAEETGSFDVYAATLKFIDKDLNPPNADCWVVEGDIFAYRHTPADKVAQKAIEASTKFYEFMVALMTDHGNRGTLDAWANYAGTLQTKLSEALGKVYTLEKENIAKTARIAELESDYTKELEAKIIRLEKEKQEIVNVLKTLAEAHDRINEIKAKRGPQW